MDNPDTLIQNRVLLVEGQNDRHVVRHICGRHPSMPSFDIVDKGGVTELLDSISIEIRAPGRQAVGFLVDSNRDLMARWDEIRHQILRAEIRLPRSPAPAGTIIEGTPRVGIWLMPDNESSGELEDFVEQMIPAGDPVWPLSQRYIDGIPQANRKFAPLKTLRAQLYAWLAAREDPRQMGLAIQARDLAVDGALCQGFVEWLMALFE